MSNTDLLMNYFIGICAALATLRCLKILRFNKRIIVFLHALKYSLKELTSFGLIFLVAWFAFTQLFYVLFNYKLVAFSTLPNSLNTCMQMVMGKGSFLFIDKNGDYDLKGICLFYIFVICVIFILMNIYLTIVNESYAKACDDMNSVDRDDPHMFEYISSILRSFFTVVSKDRVITNLKRNNSIGYLDFWDTLPIRFDGFLERFQELVSISN